MRVVVVILAIILLAAAAVRQPTLPARYVAHGHADAEHLKRDVYALTSIPRCADDPTPQLIEDEFRRSGARVTLQPYTARKHEYRNVIASFGPDNGELTIVGAHYDAFCEPRPLPGADDNASGVAALLELARLLSRERVTRPIQLVAYSTEEPPFFASDEMGSAVHARSLGNRPARAIVLEMIGCYSDRSNLDGVLGLLYPRRGDFIAVAGTWHDVLLTREVKRAMSAAANVVSFTGPAIDASDHRNYRNAVMITDTAYIRNPRYHTSRDTPDTLDYKRMATVVDGVLNALLAR